MQYSVLLLTIIIVACAPFCSIYSLFGAPKTPLFSIFRSRLAWRLGLVFASLLSCDASAADITPFSRDGVTKVIFIAGTIMPGDRQKFVNVALTTDKAVVALISDGGNLREALEIGRAVRMKGFPTYVPPNSVCASACALIWLAGSPRNMTSSAQIGFHAVYVDEAGVPEISSSGNAIVGSYLNALGLPEVAVLKLTSAAPNDMHWLTPSEALSFGIEINVLADDQTSGPQAAPGSGAVGKKTDTTSIAQLEAEATDFVKRYVGFENEEPNRSLDLVSTAYTQQVLHFGKLKTKQEVLRDYANFVGRWPSRTYSLKPGSLAVKCANQSQCAADGLLEYETASTERNAKSKGISSLHMELSRNGGAFAISAIDGKVLHREFDKFSANRGLCIGSLCIGGTNEKASN